MIRAQVVTLLESALPAQTQQPQSETPLTTEIMADIRRRRRVRPGDFGLPDSLTLFREDRDR